MVADKFLYVKIIAWIERLSQGAVIGLEFTGAKRAWLGLMAGRNYPKVPKGIKRQQASRLWTVI
jgi:hypothetical protein